MRGNLFDSDSGRTGRDRTLGQTGRSFIRHLLSQCRIPIHEPRRGSQWSGTQLYGSRFAQVGTRAVYLADSDRAASNEVLARKKRLGDKAQITLDKYPRIVFGVDVSLQKVARWLRKPRSIRLQTVREACLSEGELEASMEIGDKLQKLGIQGLLFPSVTGTGRSPARVSGQLRPRSSQVA